jgi:hypothetical protein
MIWGSDAFPCWNFFCCGASEDDAANAIDGRRRKPHMPIIPTGVGEGGKVRVVHRTRISNFRFFIRSNANTSIRFMGTQSATDLAARKYTFEYHLPGK